MESTELMQYGVIGMKWGVRNDKKTSSNTSDQNTTITKTVKRGGTTKITSRSAGQKASLTIKRNRGMKLVAKNENAKVKIVVANTANVTAGALRVAAAFIPGLSALNGVATAAALVGTVANLK